MQKHYHHYLSSTSFRPLGISGSPTLTETFHHSRALCIYIHFNRRRERSLSYLKAFTIAGRGTYIIITKAFYLLKALSRYFGVSLCFITILWEWCYSIAGVVIYFFHSVRQYMKSRYVANTPLFVTELLFAKCTLTLCPYGISISNWITVITYVSVLELGLR